MTNQSPVLMRLGPTDGRSPQTRPCHWLHVYRGAWHTDLYSSMYLSLLPPFAGFAGLLSPLSFADLALLPSSALTTNRCPKRCWCCVRPTKLGRTTCNDRRAQVRLPHASKVRHEKISKLTC